VKPELILLAGATAVKGVPGDPRGEYQAWRPVADLARAPRACRSFPPSYLLRNPSRPAGIAEVDTLADVHECARLDRLPRARSDHTQCPLICSAVFETTSAPCTWDDGTSRPQRPSAPAARRQAQRLGR